MRTSSHLGKQGYEEIPQNENAENAENDDDWL